jgi:hypothetical protein
MRISQRANAALALLDKRLDLVRKDRGAWPSACPQWLGAGLDSTRITTKAKHQTAPALHSRDVLSDRYLLSDAVYKELRVRVRHLRGEPTLPHAIATALVR